MIFNPDGLIDAGKSLAFVKRRLRKHATQPLSASLLDSTIAQVVRLVIEPDVALSECSHIEENILRRTTLVESKIRLSCVGERSLEWEFFQHRKDALPDDPGSYAVKHSEVGDLVLQNISKALYSLPKQSHDHIYRIFVRCKSVSSTRRKMQSKGLRSWEVGDYLGFVICPPSFREMEKLVACTDREFADNILYKQNGFIDRLVYHRDLQGFRGRRVFYIIRFNNIVCFEVQIVTLRQLIFLHLDHSRYIGRPHTLNELHSLEVFGNNAYLLDLRELTD